MNPLTETESAKIRQDMLSRGLIDEDQQSSDVVVYVIVFLIVVGLCAYIGQSVVGNFGPTVLVPSMIVGFGVVAVAVTWTVKRREMREERQRAAREAVAEAELQRQIKDMKRNRFENGS